MNDWKELAAEFSQAMQLGLSQEENRREIAVKIVKYLNDEIAQSDVASLLFPKEYIPLGQTAEYQVPGKIKVFWHAPGSYAPRSQLIINKTFQVPTYLLSAHPECELGQLESGRYGTMQDQISAAKEAILGALNARAFNTILGAVTSGGNYITSSGKLTVSALNEAINIVEDQVGGASAIVGRRNILYSLLDFNAGAYELGYYSDAVKDQIIKTGKIPVYRGIPVIGLHQWRDAFGKITIPEDSVAVIGKDIGKYVVSQELKSQEAIDVDTLMWHIHLYMRVGFSVFFPERIARIRIIP